MARFRILVLLLAVAGMACGALLGIGHWPGAVVSTIPLSVLAYFAARSEGYAPESPVYKTGLAEQLRKWARVTTLLGLALILIALVATLLTIGIVIPARDLAGMPVWIMRAINFHIPYTGFGLLCAGFAAWSGAVFWTARRDAGANAGGI